MAHFAKIASVFFKSRTDVGKPGAAEIVLEETAADLQRLKGLGLDLVVLSEGIEYAAFTLDNAESPDSPGPFLKLYSRFSREEHCIVAGSLKTRFGDRVFNSIAFVDRSGKVLGVYHKTFLTFGEIGEGLTSGDGAVTVDTDLGRIGGGICFDLNFEALRRQYRKLKPDIMCFSSGFHGGFMQNVWAYECRGFLVSALPFSGGGIIDPFGRPLAVTDCYAEIGLTNAAIARINLDRAIFHMDFNQDKIAGIRKKYGDEVTIDIPANIGSAMLISNSDRFSAMDIVGEFGIELIDDYFPRAVAANEPNRQCGALQ